MSKTCPFCGTDVKDGFDVCRGCGAEYQRPAEVRFKALLFIAGGVAMALFGLGERKSEATLVLVGVGALLAYVGVTKFRDAKNGAWRRVSLKR